MECENIPLLSTLSTLHFNFASSGKLAKIEYTNLVNCFVILQSWTIFY